MKGKLNHIVLFLIIYLTFNYTTRAQTLSVFHPDGSINASISTPLLNGNIHYLSINDFANLFSARTYFNVENKKFILYLGSQSLIVSAFNPFIIIDKKVYHLPTQTLFKNQDIYVPMHFFLDILEIAFPDKIDYQKENGILKIIAPFYGEAVNVNGIHVEEKMNGTLIQIKTSKDFQESDLSLRARHQWLYLDIYGGKVDSTSLNETFNNGMIARVVPSQISNELAQIGFRLRDDIVEKQLVLQNPRNIMVTIKTRSDLSKDIKQTLDKEKRKWRIDRIVIDPGHGGRDPGAIGPNGTYEKNIVLAIAKYLKEILEQETNIEVLMTREKDRFVELKKRTEFANKNQAKLFISIHANSNPSRWLRGVSTYFLGPDNTNEAREVARLENSVIRYESGNKYADLSQENFILSAMAQNIYSYESQDLAAMVHQELIQECNLQDRGVRQAGFYVLWRASMPNILIETAFISNPKEELLLRQKSFQKKLARGIFSSIMKFKQKYELEFK